MLGGGWATGQQRWAETCAPLTAINMRANCKGFMTGITFFSAGRKGPVTEERDSTPPLASSVGGS